MQTRRVKPKYKKEDALDTIDRNITWINSADNKSSILLGVFSFVFGGSLFFIDSSKIQQMIDSGIWTQWFHALGLLLCGLTMALTIIATPVILILVILSKTETDEKKPHKNITFFKDISKHQFDEFKETLLNITDNEIIDDLISQVYITSKIATKKYKMLNWGYISFVIYFVSMFIYSWLIYLL